MKEEKSREKHLFTCFIIGETSLLIRCAKELIKKNCLILGIVSPNNDNLKWAEESGIEPFDLAGDYLNVMKNKPFDYLFSIVNNTVLSDDILSMPKKFAINFHDAPLPKYAGVHATAWVIMNQEKSHGVSWHLITEIIDGGDILRQEKIDIDPGETSLTLNVKCYEAAYLAFQKLTDDIISNNIHFTKQDLTQRTYYGLSKKPRSGGIISFSQNAEEIDALVRSLNFGSNYENKLCLPKFYINDVFIVVLESQVTNEKSQLAPGVIVKINKNSFIVSTASNNILLKSLTSVDGSPLSIREFISRFKLQPGDRLSEINSSLLFHFNDQFSRVCKYEPYWLKQLSPYQPLHLPYVKKEHTSNAENIYDTEEIFIQKGISSFSDKEFENDWKIYVTAAFAAYLSRISDSTSFDIGFQAETWNSEEGSFFRFFSPFVPLKIDIDQDSSFEFFYRNLRKQIDEKIEKGTFARDILARYPQFEQTQESSGLYSQTDISIIHTNDIESYKNQLDSIFIISPVVLVVSQHDQRMILVCQSDFLSSDYAKEISKQFGVFLEKAVEQPAEQIISLPLLSKDEIQKILVDWNDTEEDYNFDTTLQRVFEKQVNFTPDEPALTFEGTTLTYREMDTRANQLANYLRLLGVGPEILVGLFMERSIEMVIGIYGIIKAGGAYVPLDPDYPLERLNFMIEDTSVPVILSQKHLSEQMPDSPAEKVYLDSDWHDISKQDKNPPNTELSADNLAYVIYTSGSTGRPKGVMNSHRGICNRLFWMQDEYQLSNEDSILQKTPYSFDVSVWEFFWPLQVGARLVIAPPGVHMDPLALVRLIDREKITTLHFVPSMLQAFLEDVDTAAACPTLKRVICSGEALPFELQERFFKKINAQLHNLYGPTEAAVDVTYHECKKENNLQIVPIGKPVANTKIYIVDKDFNPVPVGIAGELLIGGVQVARGYLNRPELTKETFIQDPFSEDENARVYKTGDLARYIENGTIEYIGRVDFQIKLRGLRIELGEIESILIQHPHIREAVVSVYDKNMNNKRLIGYVVPRKDKHVEPQNLKEYLIGKLPAYMVPDLFIMLESMPLTASGKADRKALPEPDSFKLFSDHAFTPPSSDIERELSEIWCDILNTGEVGTTDTFFSLGGNSLMIIRMLSKINTRLDLELTVAKILQHPTIKKLADFIEQNNKQTEENILAANLERADLRKRRTRRKRK